MQITTKDNGVVSQTPLVGNACILIDSLLDTATGVTRIVTFTTPVNCIISQCAHSSSVLTVSLKLSSACRDAVCTVSDIRSDPNIVLTLIPAGDNMLDVAKAKGILTGTAKCFALE